MEKKVLHVGSMKVIASGSVMSFDNLPVSIEIDPDDSNDNKLKITMTFVSTDDKAQSVSLSGSGSALDIIVKNFNNVLGTAPTDPIEIASNKSSVLSIIFKVNTSDHHRIIHYTLFSRPKDEKKK